MTIVRGWSLYLQAAVSTFILFLLVCIFPLCSGTNANELTGAAENDQNNSPSSITAPFSCLDGNYNADPCAYQNDRMCDAGTRFCVSESDCIDCDPFQAHAHDCATCVANGGLYCRDGAGFGVCSDPVIAAVFPSICINSGGTPFMSSGCDELPPTFSCSNGDYENDPCSYQSDGYCDTPFFCADESDCLDCDPLAVLYNNWGCEECVEAGGVHCTIPTGESRCNSPEIAEAFPDTCTRRDGTPYTNKCGGEQFCSILNDPCPYAIDGECDAGIVSQCPEGTSDCFDCSSCMQLRFEGCDACTNAGCVWCGLDALCVEPETLAIPAATIEFTKQFTCKEPEHFVTTCPSKAATQNTSESATLYDSMNWAYEIINVEPVWESGITGAGITVRINDGGVDDSHPDIAPSMDYVSSCPDFRPQSSASRHGTSCAALVAARSGSACSMGIAPEASISSCRILTASGDFDNRAISGFHYLYENQDYVQVSSNSYGMDACQPQTRRNLEIGTAGSCPFIQEGVRTPCSQSSACNAEDWRKTADLSEGCEQEIVQYCRWPLNHEMDEIACLSYLDLFVRCEYNAQNEEEREALIRGVTQGRNGKGIIYVYAASNARELGTDTNTEGTLNSRFTISVGSVGKDGKHSSYSSTGAALFITAPGGDIDYFANVITAAAGGGCHDAFVGTSYATPIVSGVTALMLQVNPHLSWRDVQGIFATTSQMVEPDDASWVVNAAGVHHSYRYGFGVVDAFAAVNAASAWKLYGPENQILVESGRIDMGIPEYPANLVRSFVQVNHDSSVDFSIESVVVYLDISHSSRGDLEVVLVSPGGTESILHPGARPERTQEDERWKFLTLRNWNESPDGTWSLQVMDQRKGDVEQCISQPSWSISNFSSKAFGIVHQLQCSDFALYNLCTPDGQGGSGLYDEGFWINFDEKLGLLDPVFKDQQHGGMGPLEACCECGGGTQVYATPDVLKRWRMIIYGHYA